MATINYKCDTCKREIELIENKYGLTTLSACSITKNCRGKLYSTKRNPNNIRQSLPTYDRELDDYTPRQLFYAHEQTVESSRWNVKHGFGPSCVIIVYDASGNIIDPDTYTIETGAGVSVITLPSTMTGTVHVISRIGGAAALNRAAVDVPLAQISYNGVITFAIPKYITRGSSGTTPLQPPSVVATTPTPTPSPLPSAAPYEVCNNIIRIEIEVTKPNEPTVVCTETLDASTDPKSPWFGWQQILVKNRKHYCIKTINIAKLKVFANTNDQKLIIPDGTIMRIKRIDYGTGVLTNIPDRGLLVLLASEPYSTTDKVLNKVIDCGEMVGTTNDTFTFKNFNLLSPEDLLETTYPEIKRYQ